MCFALAVSVVNVVITSSNADCSRVLKANQSRYFHVDLRELRYFLGIEVARYKT